MASKQDPRFFVEIARVDEEERMVYGYATTESVDSHGTIIDLERVKEILPDYMKFANIREMHQPSAVGVTESATVDATGLYLAAKVVDDAAWKKVTENVYKGFSIGGKKDYQIDDRIFLKSITEISLVDRPSNTDCLIDEFRLYGMEGETMKVSTEETPATGQGEEVNRGMYDVGRFGELLQSLAYVASSAQDESNWEGDASPVPAKLRAALLPLVEVYKEMAQEEIDELMAGLAKSAGGSIVSLAADADITRAKKAATDEDGDEGKDGKKADGDGDEEDTEKTEECQKAAGADDNVTRAGKRNSNKDAADLQTIHDACCRLGAACSTDVAKADSPDFTRLAQLESDVTRLQSEVDTLRSENEELKKEPAPAKGVTRVVGKEGDTEALAKPDEKRMEEVTDPTEAIRRIHQAGGQTITRL